jgi:hypothetical protein
MNIWYLQWHVTIAFTTGSTIINYLYYFDKLVLALMTLWDPKSLEIGRGGENTACSFFYKPAVEYAHQLFRRKTELPQSRDTTCHL